MKKIAFLLGVFLFLSSLVSATSVVSNVDEKEIMTYASGVLASADPNAQAVINGDTLTIGRYASDYELGDIEFAAYQAYQLALAANKIAQHYPGRFQRAIGIIMDKNRKDTTPLISCGFAYW